MNGAEKTSAVKGSPSWAEGVSSLQYRGGTGMQRSDKAKPQAGGSHLQSLAWAEQDQQREENKRLSTSVCREQEAKSSDQVGMAD